MDCLHIKCPRCQGYLEIDLRLRRVVRHWDKPPDKATAERFDAALGTAGEKLEKISGQFDDLKRDLTSRPSKLDSAFGKAIERAAETPDERPPNPMEDW